MDTSGRRYSQVPFSCDDCGSPAHVSISGGKDGHTMLCSDCAKTRGYPKGFVTESAAIMDSSSRVGPHSFTAATWTNPDGSPRCLSCGGAPAAHGRTAARVDAPLRSVEQILADGGHVASLDYPELAEILLERPDLVGTLPMGRTAAQHRALTPADVRKQRQRDQRKHPERNTEDDPFPNFETAGESLADGSGSRIWNHVVGPAIDRFEKAMPGAARPVDRTRSTDWCRFRRDSHCWYPKDLDEDATRDAGYPVWTPVDRGMCPRVNWEDQKDCKIAEAGPQSREQYVQPDATVAWEDGGQRIPNPRRAALGSVQKDGAWRDIQAKAADIQRNGLVRIISKADNVVTAEVKGEHGTYLTTVTRVPGTKQTAIWSCGCPWSTYAWARSGRWKKLEGRMCAHALATIYAMRKAEMFGGEITEQSATPIWRNEPITVEQPREKPGPWRLDRAASLLSHLTELEWQRARLLSDRDMDGHERLAMVSSISTVASVARIELAAIQGGADIEVSGLGSFEGAFKAKVRGLIRRVITLFSDHTAEVEGLGRVPTKELQFEHYDPVEGLLSRFSSATVRENETVMWDLDVDGGNHIDCPNCGKPLHVMEDPSEVGRCRECDAVYVRPKILEAKLAQVEEHPGMADVIEAMADTEFTHSGLVIKALDSGRVLMTQRTPYHKDDEETSGAWEFPGGGIDDGEDALAAALREFGEETGLSLPDDYRIDGCNANGTYLAIHVSVPNEAWTTNVELLTHETMGIGWFEPEHVQETDGLARPEVEETDWDLVVESAFMDSLDPIEEPVGPEATLHDEPEPALPSTDGAAPGANDATWGPPPLAGFEAPDTGDTESIESTTPAEIADGIHTMSSVIPGDPRLAWLMDGKSTGDVDIASAAQAWLAKTAVKDFSPAEQKQIIDEGLDVRASNLDRLDLDGTHYSLDVEGSADAIDDIFVD